LGGKIYKGEAIKGVNTRHKGRRGKEKEKKKGGRK
jgi:hypothetical protein